MENKRATFTYSDADTILIGGGTYILRGTSQEVVTWNSQITFDLKSTGSNSASDDYGADGWHYIYIDDSAVTTQASPILDADCFLNETTAPTYNHTKKGWYNGNDLAIFAVYETGDALLEFLHDGDFVARADEKEEKAFGTIGTDWSDEITLQIPSFARRANLEFSWNWVDVAATVFWRTEGQTGSTGHRVGYVIGATATSSVVNSDVVVSSNLKIDVKESTATANNLAVYLQGWYFPNGM
jgi:hypothetical protein